jgi:hypothetical protein
LLGAWFVDFLVGGEGMEEGERVLS